MNDIELAYVGVEVSDTDALAQFLGGIAGLIPGDDLDHANTWRDDDKAYRVLVTEGQADDVTVVGFEAASEASAGAIVDRLRALGYNVEDGSDTDCESRRVASLWRTMAPWGVPVEIVHGLERASTPFVSELVPDGFKTDGVGFGHMVFPVTDLEVAHRFVTEGLGMRQTDWLELPLAPGVALTARFYHCNPRHHTFALVGVPEPAPKRLHHIMFETNSLDAVGAAFDRAYGLGVPIASGLGKHDNDQMFSFYVETPAGFQIEVGHGAREVGPDWDENRAYDRISRWGHQPLTSPAGART